MFLPIRRFWRVWQTMTSPRRGWEWSLKNILDDGWCLVVSLYTWCQIAFPLYRKIIISFRYARDASAMRLVIAGPRCPEQFIGIWWMPCKNNEGFFYGLAIELPYWLWTWEEQREEKACHFVVHRFVLCHLSMVKSILSREVGALKLNKQIRSGRSFDKNMYTQHFEKQVGHTN